MITDTIYQSMRSAPELQNQFKRVALRLPHRQRLVNHFGNKLLVDPSELHGFYLYYEREYDDYIFNLLSTELVKYSRVLDIGSNIGIYTCFFANNVKRVDAFEPEKQVIERLKNNLKLNNISNVNVHEKCVSKESGYISFISPSKRNQGVGSIASEQESGTQIPCISLDDFLGDALEEACFIKMDIEGGEWLALQGGKRVLTQRKAPLSILLEVHPEEIQRLGGSVKELKLILESMNLQVMGLTPNGFKSLDSEQDLRFWWATSEKC
ncbi:MAG: FkbM family methyltransferase [Calothrix sp. MO_167.B12]|nr:FkbM family methyltransferase [Calothrix sp. MO_167.B12]